MWRCSAPAPSARITSARKPREPAQYKAAAGLASGNPSDALARGAWWELYGDRQLNDLIEKLNSANQTVAQSEAQYRQAQALVRSARGAFSRRWT